MKTCYLNGAFDLLTDARISPLDRGFLFGDGIYEFIPYYDLRPIGFGQHIQRMAKGLAAISIEAPLTLSEWRGIGDRLLRANGVSTAGLYLQVTRGADVRRSHGFPTGIEPTVFAMLADIPDPAVPDRNVVRGIRVISEEDRRWRRCNIKSSALLGNVLHFQQALEGGYDEVLLFNSRGELTEGAASNIFVVKEGEVITPALDNEKLPGINRQILLDLLRADSSIAVYEKAITMDQVVCADEIWFSNSSFGVLPVVELDGKVVGDGLPGSIWESAVRLYDAGKFDY